MTKPLRLALIGAGGIGKVWIASAKRTDKISFVAVVDVDQSKAEALAKELPGCKASTDWKEIVNDPLVDAVLVATPHNTLAQISLAALEAGKHVLCEKPAGISSAEVQKNIDVAKKGNLVYMVGFTHRQHSSSIRAKAAFDNGEIGEIQFIRARFGFGGRPGYEKEWRFNKVVSGGGELIDQGMHMIDMARWFMGDFKDVLGFAENLYWGGEVEDNGFILLRTDKHRVAQIHVSWTQWDWLHSFEIWGTKGYLLITGFDSRYHGPETLVIGKADARGGKFPEEEKIVFDKEQKEDAFVRELEGFADAVNGNDPGVPRGENAREALKIVERIYAQK